MTRFLFIALTLIVSLAQSQAQDILDVLDAKPVLQDSILVDDPEKINSFYLGSDWFGIDIAHTGWFGASLDLKKLINPYWRIDANAFTVYFKEIDSNLDLFEEDEQSGLVTRRYVRGEAVVTRYVYIPPVKLVASPLLVDSRRGPTADTNVFEYNKSKLQVKYGVRGGYYYYQHSAPSDMFGSVGDGSVSSFTCNTLVLGASRISTVHLGKWSRKYGTDYRSLWHNVYLDFLFGLGGQVDYYKSPSNSPKEIYEYPGEMNMQKFGFRLGWERLNLVPINMNMAMKLGAEIGMRPIWEFPAANDPNQLTGRTYFTLKVGTHFSR